MQDSQNILLQYIEQLELFIRAGYAERVDARISVREKHGITTSRKYEHLTIGEYERLTTELNQLKQLLPI